VTFWRRWRRSKVAISADRHHDDLKDGLRVAERKLGKRHAGGRLRVELHEANHVAPSGRWGLRQPNGEVWGGACLGRDLLWLAERNGRIHPGTTEHEMAHAVLFSHNVPVGDHHAIMASRGVA
jgi:hypothetical protein